jgi:hypothetical protein
LALILLPLKSGISLLVHDPLSWIEVLWVFITTYWMVTNWSSLEVVYGFLYKLVCKQTLIHWLESNS